MNNDPSAGARYADQGPSNGARYGQGQGQPSQAYPAYQGQGRPQQAYVQNQGHGQGGRNAYTNKAYGSRQSLASARSAKSAKSTQSLGGRSIQSEYRSHRTHQKLNSWRYGPGRKAFMCVILFIILGLLFIFIFGLLMGLWRDGGRIHLSDKEEFIPYLMLVLGILCFGIAGKFGYEAYKLSTEARKNIAYKADGADNVAVVDKTVAKARSQDNLKSGTYSHKAIGSTPNTTLASISLSMDRSMNRTHDRSTRSLPSLDRTFDDDDVQVQPETRY